MRIFHLLSAGKAWHLQVYPSWCLRLLTRKLLTPNQGPECLITLSMWYVLAAVAVA